MIIMTTSKTKIGGVALSACMAASLGVTGLAALQPAMADAVETDAPAAAAAEANAAAKADGAASAAVKADAAGEMWKTVASDKVQGTFSFTQEAVTPTNEVRSVFSKAAAVLCQGAVQEGASLATDMALTVVNAAGDELTVALADDGSGDASRERKVLSCACSTNLPGGGAISNVEVEGVSLAALAAQAA